MKQLDLPTPLSLMFGTKREQKLKMLKVSIERAVRAQMAIATAAGIRFGGKIVEAYNQGK